MHNRMFLTQHKDPTSAFYKLFFRRVGEEDFQTYSLRVENEVGVSEASVSLRRSKLTALQTVVPRYRCCRKVLFIWI